MWIFSYFNSTLPCCELVPSCSFLLGLNWDPDPNWAGSTLPRFSPTKSCKVFSCFDWWSHLPNQCQILHLKPSKISFFAVLFTPYLLASAKITSSKSKKMIEWSKISVWLLSQTTYGVSINSIKKTKACRGALQLGCKTGWSYIWPLCYSE